MNWIIENWYIVATILAAVTAAGCWIYRFLGMPSEKQKEKIREWLVWACIEAERALQSGTGQLKLREVWSRFCSVPAFSWVAKIISFEVFSDYVTEALIAMKKMITGNDALAEYVYGENAKDEVQKIRKQLEEERQR